MYVNKEEILITKSATKSGFTVLELMIALSIVAVLTAVAVPMYSSNMPIYRLKGAARMVLSDFQRAKMEAVKRNCDVELRFTPTTYSPSGSLGSYQIVEMAGNTVLATKGMPKDVTLYATSSVPFTATLVTGYTSQGLSLNNGSVYLVNNRGTSYKMSISTAGCVSMTLKTVDVSALTDW